MTDFFDQVLPPGPDQVDVDLDDYIPYEQEKAKPLVGRFAVKVVPGEYGDEGNPLRVDVGPSGYVWCQLDVEVVGRVQEDGTQTEEGAGRKIRYQMFSAAPGKKDGRLSSMAQMLRAAGYGGSLGDNNDYLAGLKWVLGKSFDCLLRLEASVPTGQQTPEGKNVYERVTAGFNKDGIAQHNGQEVQGFPTINTFGGFKPVGVRVAH